MLTRSPCESYIKYLLVHPDRYTNDAVRQILDLNRLDYIGDSYFKRLRESCRAPEVFKPRDLSHEDSQTFLFEQGIWELFHMDDAVRCAFDILDSPSAKAIVESLLLIQAPHDPVAALLQAVYDIPDATGEAIAKYKRHFWNTRILDRTDVSVLLDMRAKAGLRSDDPFVRDAVKLYIKHSRTDARVMVAKYPDSPSSALLARVQHGMTTKHINPTETLDRCLNVAALRLNEVLYIGGPKFDSKSRNLATTCKLLQEILDNRARPEEELRKQIQTLKMRTDSEEVPTLQVLSGGRHTVDLMALPVNQEEEEEDGKSRGKR